MVVAGQTLPARVNATERVMRSLQRRALFACARVYRRVLTRTKFITVTGSVGKTTTKDLIAAVMGSQFRGLKSNASENTATATAQVILAARPADKFCVQEIGINPFSRTPSLDQSIGLLRPDVAVLTNVNRDHCEIYPTLEQIAHEKGKLVAALRRSGIAVLNADDPRVMAQADRCAGRIITYGFSEHASIRGTDVRAAWPGRLSLQVSCGSESVQVRTNLCGEHWAPSILAAIATGVAMGVPLAAAAEAIRKAPPSDARLSPEVHADGVTWIRDDWKAGAPTVRPALELLRKADAARRIAILGTISYIEGDPAIYYKDVAKDALASAEHVFFVCPGAASTATLKSPVSRSSALRYFETVQELAIFLRDFLKKGDLVLVKGHHGLDHLERLVMERKRTIVCWLPNCGHQERCYECTLAMVPSSACPAAAAEPARGTLPTSEFEAALH